MACELSYMEFSTNEDHEAIRKGVASVVSRFPDTYWLERDEDGEFPKEFHRAMAEGGWLGLTMPEEFGGAGLGVTEAMIMMHDIYQLLIWMFGPARQPWRRPAHPHLQPPPAIMRGRSGPPSRRM